MGQCLPKDGGLQCAECHPLGYDAVSTQDEEEGRKDSARVLLPASKASVEIEFFPWKRLSLLAVGCMLCCGLMPGMALYIEMFAHAGLMSSSCPEGSDDGPCKEQYQGLTGIFSGGQFVTLLLQLPVGLVYDRYGAYSICVGGGACVFLGMLLLLIPLYGAEYGDDASTNMLFPLAFLLIDGASFANSYGIYGIMWHFPGKVTFIMSLSTATYQLSAFQPLVVQQLMTLMGLSCASGMAVFTCLVGGGVALCYLYAPTQVEYYKAAELAMGVPLPEPPKQIEICKAISEGNFIMKQNPGMHFWVIVAGACSYSLALLYQGFSGDFGTMLFGSEADGQFLSMYYVFSNAVIGGFVAPAGIVLSEALGPKVLVLAMAISLVLASATLATTSWAGQIICSTALVSFISVLFTFFGKYVTFYCTANRFGVVQSLFVTYMVVICMPLFMGLSGLQSGLPHDLSMFQIPYLICGAVAAVTMLVFTALFLTQGPPEIPVISNDDAKEIASSFGCADLDQVVYVFRLAGQPELFQKLASSDPEELKNFYGQLDNERMKEITAKNADADAEK